MKEVIQIIHLTKSIDILKSILSNGFYTSYAQESFEGKNILIPMISFANILFRDIGHGEVVDYGQYGIVFDRDFIIEKFDLNPVFYVKNKSEIENIFSYNFQTSIIPQTLHIAKKFYTDMNKLGSIGKFSDYIRINPITNEVKSLLDMIDVNVNDEFIESVRNIFQKYYDNTLKQVLLLKPYKVQNKDGHFKIAYNEREWRKSFSELVYISEFKPSGDTNEEFTKWTKTSKPHFKDNFILNFEHKEIKCLFVENQKEVLELKQFIEDNFQIPIDVYTLDELKENE